ncbi:diguanylate cyclase [Bacillus alkalicellulosilyticus]|uniref:sensor domain-containing diguanylate cyclase n=1 Tax=Alkalihalobacterium alkalicellulosilyticum TaxID=1912214 RepID=UPI0009963E57|nr:diguanylate cyclase [Bacillus alkalicellulosilyticus]
MTTLPLPWLYLGAIALAVFSFSYIGGSITALLSYLVLYFTYNHTFLLLGTYIVVALLSAYFVSQSKAKREEAQLWTKKLIKRSNQLRIFHEINTSMQQTLQLDKLLHTILIAVTAGHGMGFNRAMVFLIDDKNQLHGKMAVGPMNSTEGYAIWEMIAAEKYKLQDLIEMDREEKDMDSDLNYLVKSLVIHDENDENNIILSSLSQNKPIHVVTIDNTDAVQVKLHELFDMNEFAVLPLVNQGKKVGVLLIDNIVNKYPISMDEIEAVIPFANQAAIAIDHARLYQMTEDMALKDGLTGLYNQRSFQQKIDYYFTNNSNQPISLIMMDIDFFKHYNDTNGHLLGNEVLSQLAKVIVTVIKDLEYCYRFGGEEFAVLLPSKSLQEAFDIAETIRASIETSSFPSGDKQPGGKLTVSVGVSSTEQHQQGSNGSKLIQFADDALYEAKRKGKNQVFSSKGEVMS